MCYGRCALVNECILRDVQLLENMLTEDIKLWGVGDAAPLTLAVVTLQTFYLGKLDLLAVYLGKLYFLSVTDFSLGKLPWVNFIVWGLDMSREQ